MHMSISVRTLTAQWFGIATVNPVEMFILAQGTHGQLSCYTINLIDFFDSTRFASQLYLRYAWLGHQATITDIKRYQHSNYFLTKSLDDNISIWCYEKPKVGILTGTYSIESLLMLSVCC